MCVCVGLCVCVCVYARARMWAPELLCECMRFRVIERAFDCVRVPLCARAGGRAHTPHAQTRERLRVMIPHPERLPREHVPVRGRARVRARVSVRCHWRVSVRARVWLCARDCARAFGWIVHGGMVAHGLRARVSCASALELHPSRERPVNWIAPGLAAWRASIGRRARPGCGNGGSPGCGRGGSPREGQPLGVPQRGQAG